MLTENYIELGFEFFTNFKSMRKYEISSASGRG